MTTEMLRNSSMQLNIGNPVMVEVFGLFDPRDLYRSQISLVTTVVSPLPECLTYKKPLLGFSPLFYNNRLLFYPLFAQKLIALPSYKVVSYMRDTKLCCN